MRILITLDFPPENGGIQNYLFNIVKHEFNHSDLVITCGKKFKNETNLPPKIKRVIKLPYKKLSLILMIPTLFKLSFLKKIKKFECGNIYGALLPWLLSFFYDIKYSVYTYGTELIPLKKRGIKSFILKSVLNRSDSINALLESQKELINSITSQAKINIIPPKIKINNKWKAHDINRSDKLRILSVGRLVKHKGHEVLLNAISKMDDNYSLTIIGNGPEYKNLSAIIKKKELQHRVTLKNKLSSEKVSESYENADIFVLPSLDLSSGREGFGIVLLEAISHSIPVIASNCGGIPEVLGNGKYGILVAPGNHDELATSIYKLHHNKKLYNQLTKDAFQNLVKNYAW